MIMENLQAIDQPLAATPSTTAVEAVNKQRHFLAVFFLSFMWGLFGADRFYLGKTWTGILKLLTIGGFGIWAIIDLTMVMSGSMRDKQGNEMLDYAKYKKFASRIVLIFGIVMVVLIVLTGVSVAYAINQFIQNGGMEKLLQGASGQTTTLSPNLDLNQLKNLNLNL
jgi:TM2 domain-containing membrane protein YozV